MASEFAVRVTPSAARDLRKLPADVRRRLRAALEGLATDPHRGKALKGDLTGLRSSRESSYRVVYQIREREFVVLVIAIGHRREIYERAVRREP